jgi:hypothetical protein
MWVVRNDYLPLSKLNIMKKFIVIDKQEGISWICDDIEDIIKSVGYEGEIWDDIKDKIVGVYEVIEIIGEIKYLID